MSNALYPTLTGLMPTVMRTAMWSTTVKTTPSGREYRGAFMTSPRYKYRLAYEFLRDTAAAQELAALVGFYNARQGAFDSFLFNDPDDNAVTAQAFGVGDGASVLFQLVRTRGGVAEPVYWPVAGFTVTVNGSPASFTENGNGGITFAAAPAAGAALVWSGSLYWRCRFAEDELSVEQFMAKLWEAKMVEFLTVKP